MNFFHVLAVSSYSPKIKKKSGATFESTVFVRFFRKTSSYLILYLWKICHTQHAIQCHTFSFYSRYQTQCAKFLFRQLKRSQVLRFTLYSSDWQEEKDDKKEIQKFEYLEHEKRFIDEMKSIFRSFWRALIHEKK